MKSILCILLTFSLSYASYDEVINAVDKGNFVRAKIITRYDAISSNPKAMYNMALFEYLMTSPSNALRWLKRSYKAGYNRALFGEAIILFSHSQEPYYLSLVHNNLVKVKEKDDIVLALLHVNDDIYFNTSNATKDEYLMIGKLYYNNTIIKPNIALATTILRYAANKNSVKAYRYLGNIYRDSNAENSLFLALESYKKAYELGEDKASLYNMGKILLSSVKSVQNVEKGQLLINRAIAGGYQPHAVSKEFDLPLKKY